MIRFWLFQYHGSKLRLPRSYFKLLSSKHSNFYCLPFWFVHLAESNHSDGRSNLVPLKIPEKVGPFLFSRTPNSTDWGPLTCTFVRMPTKGSSAKNRMKNRASWFWLSKEPIVRSPFKLRTNAGVKIGSSLSSLFEESFFFCLAYFYIFS